MNRIDLIWLADLSCFVPLWNVYFLFHLSTSILFVLSFVCLFVYICVHHTDSFSTKIEIAIKVSAGIIVAIFGNCGRWRKSVSVSVNVSAIGIGRRQSVMSHKRFSIATTPFTVLGKRLTRNQSHIV